MILYIHESLRVIHIRQPLRAIDTLRRGEPTGCNSLSDSVGLQVAEESLAFGHFESVIKRSVQGCPILLIEGHWPGCFPTIPTLTAFDWLNPPDPGDQQYIGQGELENKQDSAPQGPGLD